MEFLENFEQANTLELPFVVLANVCEASPLCENLLYRP